MPNDGVAAFRRAIAMEQRPCSMKHARHAAAARARRSKSLTANEIGARDVVRREHARPVHSSGATSSES
jgi:hypothetical protein